MRLRIVLEPAESEQITLPIQYNDLVQALIYYNLDRALSTRLHDRGHGPPARPYKLFTFSRLTGDARFHDGRITFRGPVTFRMSSVDDEVLASLAEHLLTRPAVLLGRELCRVGEVVVEPFPQIAPSGPVLLRALSPITAYTTLTAPDGRRKTYYYAPQERDWSASLVASLARKARVLGWEGDVEEELRGAYVRPHRVRIQDQKVLRYKGTVIKGWTGVYEASLPERYLRLAYDSGLGSKNPAGFGLVEVVR